MHKIYRAQLVKGVKLKQIVVNNVKQRILFFLCKRKQLDVRCNLKSLIIQGRQLKLQGTLVFVHSVRFILKHNYMKIK